MFNEPSRWRMGTSGKLVYFSWCWTDDVTFWKRNELWDTTWTSSDRNLWQIWMLPRPYVCACDTFESSYASPKPICVMACRKKLFPRAYSSAVKIHYLASSIHASVTFEFSFALVSVNKAPYSYGKENTKMNNNVKNWNREGGRWEARREKEGEEWGSTIFFSKFNKWRKNLVFIMYPPPPPTICYGSPPWF